MDTSKKNRLSKNFFWGILIGIIFLVGIAIGCQINDGWLDSPSGINL